MLKKTKLVLYFALFIAIVFGATGCMCTNAVIGKSNPTIIHTFSNPSAIYQKANQNVYALEGINHDSRSNHAYLIIHPEEVAAVDRLTNKITSLADIEQLQHALERSHGIPYQSGLEVKCKLPSGYQKITDLRQNNVSIYTGESQPNGWLGILFPVTAVVDIVTFPFQFIYLATHVEM